MKAFFNVFLLATALTIVAIAIGSIGAAAIKIFVQNVTRLTDDNQWGYMIVGLILIYLIMIFYIANDLRKKIEHKPNDQDLQQKTTEAQTRARADSE